MATKKRKINWRVYNQELINLRRFLGAGLLPGILPVRQMRRF